MATETILVVQRDDPSLGCYALESGEETGRVPLDAHPDELALSPEGRYAYLCHPGPAETEGSAAGGHTVSVVDVPARQRVGTVDCGEYRRPRSVDVDAEGALYVLSEATGHLLTVREPLRGRVDGALPTGGKGSHFVRVTRDGAVAFCSNPGSGSVTAVFPRDPGRDPVPFAVGGHAEGSVLDGEHGRLYVALPESSHVAVIDVAELTLLEPVSHPAGPVRLCPGPDGLLLVALHGEQALALTDPARGVQAVIGLPERPVSVGYHAASRTAIAATVGDHLCLVDTQARKVTRSIATRAGPGAVALAAL